MLCSAHYVVALTTTARSAMKSMVSISAGSHGNAMDGAIFSPPPSRECFVLCLFRAAYRAKRAQDVQRYESELGQYEQKRREVEEQNKTLQEEFEAYKKSEDYLAQTCKACPHCGRCVHLSFTLDNLATDLNLELNRSTARMGAMQWYVVATITTMRLGGRK